MARSSECQCTYNFTCGYCLRNMKPWFFTLSDGSAIAEIPVQGKKQEVEEDSQS